MTRFYEDTSKGTLILDATTHQVADLFNVAYETMLLMLLRFFAHTEESEAELERLSRATLRIMTTVIRPLGEALTKMPVGDPRWAGMTAGPGFGYNRDVSLLPHKKSAWIFFGERLRELAIVAARLRSQTGVPREVEESVAALEGLAQEFVPAGRSWSRDTELAEFASLETARNGHDRAGAQRTLPGHEREMLTARQVHPREVQYYLDERDREFDAKMVQVLHVYEDVEIWREKGIAPADLVAVL